MEDGVHGMLIGGTIVLEIEQNNYIMKIVYGSLEGSFLDVWMVNFDLIVTAETTHEWERGAACSGVD